MDAQRWMRFFAPDVQVRSLGLACLGVGVQRGHLLTVGPRSVTRHVVVVVRAGQGWFRSRGGPRVDVVAPAVLWLLPGEEHHYGVDPETGWDEFFVCFDGPATSLYTTMGFLPRRTSWSPLADIGPLEPIRTQLLSVARPDNPLLDVEAAVLVHELVLALRSAASADPQERAERDLLDELTRNAFLPLSVTEHSHRLGLSTEQLRSLVRRRTGRTPKDHLLTVRLEHAQELLSATDLSMAEVGRIVGYPDPAYFSRLFTRRLGVSPSVFRSEARVRERTRAQARADPDQSSS